MRFNALGSSWLILRKEREGGGRERGERKREREGREREKPLGENRREMLSYSVQPNTVRSYIQRIWTVFGSTLWRNLSLNLLWFICMMTALHWNLGQGSVTGKSNAQWLMSWEGAWQRVSYLDNWYFEPSQPQRVPSWLKTMFNLSPICSAHKPSNHKFSKKHKISLDTE